MKKALSAIALALVVIAGAQTRSQAIPLPLPTLDSFKDAFQGFSNDMAGTLALNSSVGTVWSDSFTGGFPHFGAGFALGTAFASSGALKSVFDAVGIEMPLALSNIGLPFPIVAATAKIGLPFLPLDVGIKLGYLPPETGESIRSLTGVSTDYVNIGAQVRLALLRENLLLPAVSLGLGANYQKGSIGAPIPIPGGSTSFSQNLLGLGVWNLTISDPNLGLSWESSTYDATVQVSKRLLVVTPYAGAGYTIGTNAVRGGLTNALGVTQTLNGVTTEKTVDDLGAAFAAVGVTAPNLDAFGFSFGAQANDPVMRLYGGIALNILVLILDIQATYVPLTNNLGTTLTARLQI
ncbi:MAG: hypothetical protein ACOYM2_11285 [Rectinemataceae bacterium]